MYTTPDWTKCQVNGLTRFKGRDSVQAMEQQTGFKEMFLRLVAIVGLIAVLILGAWGIILLAFNLVGIFTGSVHIQDLFKSTPTEQVATTTTPVVVTQNNGNTSNTNTGSTKPTTSSAQPTAVYTAAPRVAQLYGLSDLVVTMQSVTSLSSVQGRVVVQFTVTNVGTNVTNSGWTFNAQLPLQPTYTYQTQGQQALYPGDSIAYTLTYDDPRFTRNQNQYCTLQYPNYNCNYYNQNQNYYNQYNYQNYNNTGICYTYNGYQNIPGPCPYGYDNNSNPIYGSNYNYNQYYNQYTNPNYNYGYNYNGVVTITVDPQNWVPESAEYNNTASRGF